MVILTKKEKALEKKRVKCHTKVSKLLNHPRNDYIILQKTSEKGVAFCIIDKNGKKYLYSGLTKKLKRLLYPDLEENPWNMNPKARQGKHYKIKYKRGCTTFGAVHGSSVHAEIELFVKEFGKTQNWNNFMKLVPNPDPCTCRIIQKCLDSNWYPIFSEFKLFNEDWRTASAIDLLVVDQNKWELILIEIKCGYENEVYTTHSEDKMFKAPFNDIINCPKNRHTMQVLSMILMLKKKYGITITQSYILRSLPKAKILEVIPLPKWAKGKEIRRNLDILLSSET